MVELLFFKEKTVGLTKYSLMSHSSVYHLVQWVVEGSNDGTSWEELDKRNTRDLNGEFITKTYDCQGGKGKSFRYLRLRQTGKNACWTDDLLFKIEFFGTLHRGGSR